jgi:hypothetical protein
MGYTWWLTSTYIVKHHRFHYKHKSTKQVHMYNSRQCHTTDLAIVRPFVSVFKQNRESAQMIHEQTRTFWYFFFIVWTLISPISTSDFFAQTVSQLMPWAAQPLSPFHLLPSQLHLQPWFHIALLLLPKLRAFFTIVLPPSYHIDTTQDQDIQRTHSHS